MKNSIRTENSRKNRIGKYAKKLIYAKNVGCVENGRINDIINCRKEVGIVMNVNREVINKACEAFNKVKGDEASVRFFFRNEETIETEAKIAIDGFLDVIGNEGALIIPAFVQQY